MKGCIKGRGCIKGCVLINDSKDVTLATRMAKFKIGEFEDGDLASMGVRKWTALLEVNCDWFGVTEAVRSKQVPSERTRRSFGGAFYKSPGKKSCIVRFLEISSNHR